MEETDLSACVDTLVEENRCSLHQLESLLVAVSPTAYRRGFDAEARQTLGRHVRHILDHYQALLNGVDVACIDYEARVREPDLEQDPAVARERLGQIREGLTRLGEYATASLQVRYPVDEAGDSLSLTTSLARELGFLDQPYRAPYGVASGAGAAARDEAARRFRCAPLHAAPLAPTD